MYSFCIYHLARCMAASQVGKLGPRTQGPHTHHMKNQIFSEFHSTPTISLSKIGRVLLNEGEAGMVWEIIKQSGAMDHLNTLAM